MIALGKLKNPKEELAKRKGTVGQVAPVEETTRREAV
jgi:hypothetical protein